MYEPGDMDPSVVDAVFGLEMVSNDECYYEILGCDELSSTEQIIAEYRARARQCHPDKTGNDDDNIRFKRLLEAKEVLCDIDSRREYDQWKRSGLKIPFKTWRSIHASRTPAASMHWQSAPAKKPMLTSSDYNNEPHRSSGRTPDEILRMFRNYEI